MRVLCVDTELCGLDFSARCVAADHEVMLFQQTSHPIGVGFKGVKRTDDLQAALKWVGRDGLVFPTGNSKFLVELDRWRDMGWKIFGPTVQSAALEIDRAKGMEAMKAAGIDVPAYHQFNSLEEAQAFARKSDAGWVFKTLGSEDDKSLTMVANDPAELVGWMQRQQDRGLTLKGPCILQEKIDMIAELGVSGWFGPEGFLPDRWNQCWEHKRLMSGEIGPQTGEMGSVLCYSETDKLAEEMLVPMIPILKTLGHRGDFAIGAAIDSKGKAWPLEWTARAGWPAWWIQTASHKNDDPATWMRDLLDGKDSLRVDHRPAVGVVMAQPPWPQFNGKPDCVEGNPISGMDDVWDQVAPAMMEIVRAPFMKDGKVADGPTYATAGELVCCVTGLGSTVSKAAKKAYDAVGQIKYADAMYRDEIGEKVEDCLPAVRRFGYCENLEY